ncbi:hypothetical protein JBP901_gp090 [Bacillus phage JBP901]|uniref:Uncharacterized protein n=2 Tax=Caeruleovirus TaxID=1911929 RepID=A0A0E3DF90_9CAUD|nr:hypothetical protein JBP901_gp090 [Bacillus phage JBP901]YP_009149690.1 hypothetical protein BCP8-2_129 [Bacillus phage BCP8-2]AHJ87167.1 hypothetical protein BCP8-2_129 [Bacillus phage BCP8-2]AID17802.1 hypothetical protein JBP901_gp090 [Bacillus phage JBP901]
MTRVQVKHNKTGEVAVIVENEAGIVTVTKNGQNVSLANQTAESVEAQFNAAGWVTQTPETELFEASHKQVIQVEDVTLVTEVNKAGETNIVEGVNEDDLIPAKIKKDLDEYLRLHAEAAKLKTQMDKLKKGVREYMDNNKLTEVKGSNGKKVVLQEGMKSNSSSVYTDYNFNDVAAALNDNELLKEVTEVRINGDKLKGLLGLGKLPNEKVKEIQELKIAIPGTPKFVVKNN